MAQKDIQYPQGVRDLTGDISTDDLVQRLRKCAYAFQNMSQEEDNSAYIPLALYLASERFLEHRSPEVQLLVACCIADVFRVYAPEAPYKDVAQLKEIFEFFVEQLKGLSITQSPSFKLYFYLLENLSCVKTFNICFEFEDNGAIIHMLFKLIFKIINDNHNGKVRKFMLDMLTPLITEADTVGDEILQVLFQNIIEPIKSKKTVACVLAQDIIKRTASTLEPYIQHFFNNALVMGRSIPEMNSRIFEVIFELNNIAPSLMVMVLPHVECKLKSTDEAERMQVTEAVAKMFINNKSLINQNKSLWSSLLLRFADINSQIRLLCVKHCKHFLLDYPECKEDLAEHLIQRSRDTQDDVRLAVISLITQVAATDLDCVNDKLMECVKERTLDKKEAIRKEAVMGLSKVYKRYIGTPQATSLESISWIKNKVLHMYYQDAIEDRIQVERCIYTCFVPYQRPMEERMKLLYQLYCSIDDHAVRAFKEILRYQKMLRSQVKIFLETIHQKEKSSERMKTINNTIVSIAKSLVSPLKAKQCLNKFFKDSEENTKMSRLMYSLLHKNITCSDAESKVKEILKCIKNPVQNQAYYNTIKMLLERIAPVMIDKDSIKYLVEFVKDSLIGSCAIEAELGLKESAKSGLDLLLLLTYTCPHHFNSANVYNNLMLFLQTDQDYASDATLQIFINVASEVEKKCPEVCSELIILLQKFVETGTPKQAKHAVYCLDNIVLDRETIFGAIINNLKKHLTLKSEYYRTALVSIGHLAYLNSKLFENEMKEIIKKIIHELLMLDQDYPRGGEDMWDSFDSLPDETKCKIEGLKVMIRWLIGLKDFKMPALSTLNLFTNILDKDGELNENIESNMAPVEKSWMRSSASSCILKLCHEPNYAPLVSLDTFILLGDVVNDKCPEVAERFVKKLHKGLYNFKLPLQYLAMLCLVGLSGKKAFQEQAKSYLKSNIQKRRTHVIENSLSNEELPLYLPDYSLAYAVYLLAHSKVLTKYDDVNGLKKIKECLKILLDCLMARTENYSFPFFKRLLENIKQTKDIKAVPNKNETDEIKKEKEQMNLKMYAVCDLGLQIILSKPNHILNEFPAEPILNAAFFTEPDKSYSNMETYLPPELLQNPKEGFEFKMFDASKTVNSIEQEETNIDPSVLASTSHAGLNGDSSLDDESVASPSSSVAQRNTQSQRASITSISESEASPAIIKRSHNEAQGSISECSDVEANIEESRNSDVSKDSGVSSSSAVKKPKGRPRKIPQTNLRSTLSPNTSTSTLPEDKLPPAFQEDQSSPSKTVETSSCTSNYNQVQLKECNVRLSKDEVDNYTGKRSPEKPVATPIKVPGRRGRPRKIKPIEGKTVEEDSSQSSSNYGSVESPKKNTRSQKIPAEEKPSPSVDGTLTESQSKSTLEESPKRSSRSHKTAKETPNSSADESLAESGSVEESPKRGSRSHKVNKETPNSSADESLAESPSKSSVVTASKKNTKSLSSSEKESPKSSVDETFTEASLSVKSPQVSKRSTRSRKNSGLPVEEVETDMPSSSSSNNQSDELPKKKTRSAKSSELETPNSSDAEITNKSSQSSTVKQSEAPLIKKTRSAKSSELETTNSSETTTIQSSQSSIENQSDELPKKRTRSAKSSELETLKSSKAETTSNSKSLLSQTTHNQTEEPPKKKTRSAKSFELETPNSSEAETPNKSPLSSMDNQTEEPLKKKTRGVKNSKSDTTNSSEITTNKESQSSMDNQAEEPLRKRTRGVKNSEVETPYLAEANTLPKSSFDNSDVESSKITRSLRNSKESNSPSKDEASEVSSQNSSNSKSAKSTRSNARLHSNSEVETRSETDSSSQNSLVKNNEEPPKKKTRSAKNSAESLTSSTSEATSGNASHSSLDTNIVDIAKKPTKSLKKSEAKPTAPVLSRRKRLISPPKRFLPNDEADRPKSSSSSSPVKSSVKNGKSARETRPVQKSAILSNQSSPSSSEAKGTTSKVQSQVNNVRSQRTISQQKKTTQLKTTGKRR
ncbi:hypothetical protein JTE90_008957 [Oedothorax gibbosus]|uniref:Uncharacterized protein n=1 Tax=Oedothorax gibbosus TaxID=931172 RepID=A0AAV6UVG7_9ARAC|nr:hypothetical protein JTE90_008957 [Oedothorax gibbosus]